MFNTRKKKKNNSFTTEMELDRQKTVPSHHRELVWDEKRIRYKRNKEGKKGRRDTTPPPLTVQ